MPDKQGRLYAVDIAEQVGISQSDWRSRVSRGYAPAPNGYVNDDGTVRAVWTAAAIDDYLRARQKRRASRGDQS